MTILSFKIDEIGETGVTPRIIRLNTNNTVAELLATGYLNDLVYKQNAQLSDSDLAIVTSKTTPGAISTQVGVYEVSKSGSDWSLVAVASPGRVQLPTTPDEVAVFLDTIGTLGEAADTSLGIATITGGLAVLAAQFLYGGTTLGGSAGGGLPGTLAFRSNTNVEVMRITAVGAVGVMDIVNQTMVGTATRGVFIPDPAASDWSTGNDGSLLMSNNAPNGPSADVKMFDVTVTAAQLASGGTVELVPSTGTENYRIRELFINSGGTNFSGGGGDRLLSISDGTTTYSVVPSATLQSLVNARWGSTEVPFPAAAAINTASTDGDSIVALYSGGSNDFATGSIVISGIVERIN